MSFYKERIALINTIKDLTYQLTKIDNLILRLENDLEVKKIDFHELKKYQKILKADVEDKLIELETDDLLDYVINKDRKPQQKEKEQITLNSFSG